MRLMSQIEIREVDRLAIEQFGIPGVVLMENAGRGCSQLIQEHWVTGRVVICCGKGNNGGDGFVIARYLENAGWTVKVRLAFPSAQVSGDAAIFLTSIIRSKIDVRTLQSTQANESSDPETLAWSEFLSELDAADLVVDALLGTGLVGDVRPPYTEIIEAINSAGRPVLAVDLPSGMDCNTGKPLGTCVGASRTATLVTFKLGFDHAVSRKLTGPIDVVEIGLPQALVDLLDPQTPRAPTTPPTELLRGD